jgi:hypothetical protein
VVDNDPLEIFRNECPKAWKEAKKEIFRLQLLNEYLVKEEKESYEAYKKGKVIYDPEIENTLEFIANKKAEGTRIINLLVVDLPLSTYAKYSIEMGYLFFLEKGEETFLVERSKVSDLVNDKRDFWLFDNSEVIPMLYHKDGRLIGAAQPITGKEVENYVRLKEELLAKATPLKEFLKENNLDLIEKKAKNRSF